MVKISLLKGLYLGVALVIVTQILTWIGLGTSNWFTILSNLTVIVFIILCLREVKQALGNVITFSQAAISLLALLLISTLIFQLYMFIYTRYVDPSWVETVSETWTLNMRNSQLSEEIIAKRIDSFRNAYKTIPMFTSGLAMYVVPQFIMGMIISLFFILKKKKLKE